MRTAGWLLLLLAAAAAGAGAAPAPQGEEGCGALLGDVCAAVCAIGDECADEECRVNVDVGFVRSSKDLCECGGPSAPAAEGMTQEEAEAIVTALDDTWGEAFANAVRGATLTRPCGAGVL